MTRNRRGFTLMEMLIAITVLVMLSGVTLFSTLDFVTTADANKVINDMMQLKTAMLMWYKENSSRVVLDGKQYKIKTNGEIQPFKEFIRDHQEEILRYIANKDTVVIRNKEDGTNNTGDFTFIDVNDDKTKSVKWYICCNLGSPNLLTKGEEAPDAKVREKIAGQAKKFNLLGIGQKGDTPNDKNYYTAEKRFVCMLIIQWNR